MTLDISYIHSLFRKYLENKDSFLGMGIKVIGMILIGLFIFYTLFFISACFHELGHFLWAYLLGGNFISLKIFSFLIIKKHKKIVMVKMKGALLEAYCNVSPPKTQNKLTASLILAGGGLGNGMLALIFLFITIFSSGSINLISYFSYVLNLFLMALNLIPLKGISNDGSMIVALFKDEGAVEAYHKYHRILERLQYINIEEVAESDIKIPKHWNLKNDICSYFISLNMKYYIQKHQYGQAIALLGKIDKIRQELRPHIQKEITEQELYLYTKIKEELGV